MKTKNMETEKTQNLTTLDAAQLEVNKLKEMMAEAKKKLAEAKKANSKSRPVRLSTFMLTVVENKDADEVGEVVMKSDVHYCTEKAGIDILVDSIKESNEDESRAKNEYVYRIYKIRKADDAGNPKLVSQMYVDWETKQVVID